VLPVELVAVAVRNRPGLVPGKGSLKVTCPLVFVTTCWLLSNSFPSPKPLGSSVGLTKKSSTNEVRGVLCKVPVTTVTVPSITAAVSTG
jgi:hypothetical protein